MTRVTSRRMVALAAAGLLVPAWAQAPPSPARIAELSEQWADPVTDAPPGTSYHLFETASRGKGSKGSYLVYLPPSYETETARRYPVIYWLHGGFGNARQGAWAVEHLDRGIRAGLVPEAIVVLPQALPVGWYVNSKDGKRPIEDVIIKDLIPHVDATYRTIDRRESRGIEGMSMGGYGALHLGMKYPALFGAISSVAPAILPDLKDEPRERTFDTFGDDEAYYDANGPWTLARANATALRQGCAIRLLAGDEDARLRSAITGFDGLLTELGIPHQSSEVRGAGHVYEDIVGGLGDEGFAFWRQAFGTRPAPSLVDPYVARPRVVVMTDIANEPDDQMSMVRFLLYSNQFDVEGLVASTSTWMKNTGPARRHPLGPRRLREGAAEPAEARARLPDGGGAAGRGGAGTAGLRHGGGGRRQDVARGRADPPRRREGRPPSALGPRLGRHQHARPGARSPRGPRGRRRRSRPSSRSCASTRSPTRTTPARGSAASSRACTTSRRRPRRTARSTPSPPGRASAATASTATRRGRTSRPSPTSG